MFPSQLNTKSTLLISCSFSLRDTSFENAVNTTMGTAGNSFLRAAAPSKVSPISPPGMAITISKLFARIARSASPIVDTRVTRGGELRFRATYSL